MYYKRHAVDYSHFNDVLKWLLLALYKMLYGMVCAGLFYRFCVKGIISNFNEIILLMLLFYLLLGMLTKIYSSLNIGNERISDLLISQAVALLLAYSLTLIIFQALHFFDSKYHLWLFSVLVTLAFMVLWTILGNKLFFSLYPALRTILINGSKNTLDLFDLIRLYPKKFNIMTRLSVSELVKDMNILENYDAVLLNDVDNDNRDEILKFCLSQDIKIFIRPELVDILMSSSYRTNMLNIPLLFVRQKSKSIGYTIVKRAGDIVLSLIGLIVASPLMLLIGLAVRIGDGGPAFYKQLRLTNGGRKFWLVKFRSMRVDAERDGVARLATQNDDRITSVGHFIRKMRLDELPQLYNILKGDMSFVGPRPERPEIAQQYEKSFPEFKMRLLCKAGLTGYAQVYGKYNTTPYNKLQMDLLYIMNRSFFVDLKLLIATFRVLFISDSTEGVRRGAVTAMYYGNEIDNTKSKV